MPAFIIEHFVALAITAGICVIIGLSMLGAEEMATEGDYNSARTCNVINFVLALCGCIIGAVLSQYAEQQVALYLMYSCAIVGGLVAMRSGYNTIRPNEYVSY